MDSLQLDLTALAEQLEQKGETSPAFSWDNHAAAPAPWRGNAGRDYLALYLTTWCGSSHFSLQVPKNRSKRRVLRGCGPALLANRAS